MRYNLPGGRAVEVYRWFMGLEMLVNTFDKMTADKRNAHLLAAESYLKKM